MKENVKSADILAEVSRLRENGLARAKDLFVADDFTVDIRVAKETDPRREHICSEDEFTYVLDGEVEAHVAGQETVILHSGEGIMVKAGVVHMMLPTIGTAWMLVSKPHLHLHPQ